MVRRLSRLLAGVMLVTLVEQGHAQIPEKVMKEMDFLVGSWEAEGTYHEQPLTGFFEIRWAPGKACLLYRNTWRLGKTVLEASTVTGWDAKEKRVVEYHYGSSENGGRLEISYDTERERDAWVGTRLHITTKGEKVEGGTSRLERKENAFIYISTETIGGKKVTSRITNRRLLPQDGEKAFKELADYLIGGTWMHTPAKGPRFEHTYRWRIKDRFLEVVQKGGDGEWIITVGVDPLTKRVTWWNFREDGLVNTATVIPGKEKGKWLLRWEGVGSKGIQEFLTGTFDTTNPNQITIEVHSCMPDPDKLTGTTMIWKREPASAPEKGKK